MYNTGVVRKIDELGRIVIPKEIRRNLGIKNGEEIEIYVEKDSIILKKNYRLFSLKEQVYEYLKLFNKYIFSTICITDRDKIITFNKIDFSYLNNKKISTKLSNIIEQRKEDCGSNLNISEDKVISGNYYIKPIIVNTDLVGSIICISNENISEQEKFILEILNALFKLKLETD